MDAFELAKKYYPSLWSKDRLKVLVERGKLTKDQYKEVTGEEYEE